MSKTKSIPCSGLRSLALGVALAGAAITGAQAGGCPADKITTEGQKPGVTAPKGLEDRVVASIDLINEHPHLKEHKLRLRRLVIQPGGVVPWHSHGERPAIIYIISGQIIEYASTCAVPIVHKAGDVTAETHTTAHWWKNNGRKPVVLLSADILHDKSDPKMM